MLYKNKLEKLASAAGRRKFMQQSGGLFAMSMLPAAGMAQAGGSKKGMPVFGNSEVVKGIPPAKLVGRPDPEKFEVPEAPEKRMGFAIVGLGDYAVNYIMPNMASTTHCKVTALVSGNAEKCKEVGEAYGISEDHLYSYDTMDQLANDDMVDVVYIITPNAFHRQQTEQAFAAGKHVLCEKPMAVTAEDCEAMIAAGKKAGKKLMMAYRAQYDPYNLEAIRMIQEGRIGTPSFAVADHGRLLKLEEVHDQWRAVKEIAGGGSLYDIGIYSVNGVRYLFDEEPVSVIARYHEGSGREEVTVEEGIEWRMVFPSGAVANCSSSYLTAENKRMMVQGDKGEITLDPATNYYIRNLQFAERKGDMNKVEHIEISNPNQFVRMLDEMALSVLENREPKTPGEEGLRDIRILEAIYESAEKNQEVSL